MNEWETLGKNRTYETEAWRLTIRLNKDGWKGYVWVNDVKKAEPYETSPALPWGFVQGDFERWAQAKLPRCEGPRVISGNSGPPRAMGQCPQRANRKVNRKLLCDFHAHQETEKR